MAKYGLIGKGIDHSHSPFLHQIIGNYEYELIDVQDESELKAILEDTSYDGFNVTMPYKESVIKYIDDLTPWAVETNAVNTIKRMPDGTLTAYNTDVRGFIESVGDRAKGRKCLIFGTGGAARAVGYGLKLVEAKDIIYVSRNPEEARTRLRKDDKVISYNELDEHSDAQVIINATPIGHMDSIDKSILSETGNSVRIFTSLELAMDLIYCPYRTKFLQDARRLTGCKTASGLEMLIHQGIAARGIWTGSRRIPFFERIASSSIKRRLLVRQLNIVAVGMPGCGKTSIFRKYAHEMKLDFIDIDHETEVLMGDTIENVLSEGGKGEEYFRNMESKAILAACKRSRVVIATGGGAILNPINRDLLKANSLVIYVKRPLHMLATFGRPISEERGVEALYEERDRIYRRVADFSINNNKNFGDSLDKNGNKNSYGYDMKVFVFHAKAMIEKYIFDIAGNRWV